MYENAKKRDYGAINQKKHKETIQKSHYESLEEKPSKKCQKSDVKQKN